jgi:hypothetical protein
VYVLVVVRRLYNHVVKLGGKRGGQLREDAIRILLEHINITATDNEVYISLALFLKLHQLYMLPLWRFQSLLRIMRIT